MGNVCTSWLQSECKGLMQICNNNCNLFYYFLFIFEKKNLLMKRKTFHTGWFITFVLCKKQTKPMITGHDLEQQCNFPNSMFKCNPPHPPRKISTFCTRNDKWTRQLPWFRSSMAFTVCQSWCIMCIIWGSVCLCKRFGLWSLTGIKRRVGSDRQNSHISVCLAVE